MSSVLGLVPCSGGRIILDGEDVSTLPSQTVRKRVTCVTQDPFLFTGSVRINLDPLEVSSDAGMKDALQRVGLWDIVKQDVADAKVLDQEMDTISLSHGQSQLFCFARAVLRKSPLVILDEPTSRYVRMCSGALLIFPVSTKLQSRKSMTLSSRRCSMQRCSW